LGWPQRPRSAAGDGGIDGDKLAVFKLAGGLMAEDEGVIQAGVADGGVGEPV
jgi:hypothetical protein